MKKPITILIISILLITAFWWLIPFFKIPSTAIAKISVHVIDLDGNPIPNADVFIGFEHSIEHGDSSHKVSDSLGYTSASGRLAHMVNVVANKDGYYESKEVFWYRDRFPNANNGFVWSNPWNPTIDIVLKEKKNPIPMIVRNLELDIPEFNQVYGLDLMEGDWVGPHGKGKVIDLIIKANGHQNQTVWRDTSFELAITFPNDEDGIQIFYYHPMNHNHLMGSDLRSLHEAPIDKYESTWSWRSNRVGNEIEDTQEKQGIGYYIRTRSDLNGMYSKIYGRISGGLKRNTEPPYGGAPYITFKYYTNPTLSDRNIECDISQNLAIPTNATPREKRDSKYTIGYKAY